MTKINENYLKLPGSYLFAEISNRVSKFQNDNPDTNIIRLGIGDVTKPLSSAIISGLHAAVNEMGNQDSFKGYGPYEGYDFLIEKIIENDYEKRKVNISYDEIFVSDGAKSDTGNIQELFDVNSIVAVLDPVYPVYVDSNVMAGRTGLLKADGRFDKMIYLSCTAENNFVPDLPNGKVDLIYLCFPNNPTGTTLNKNQLKKWVNYAIENKSIILYDAAYEAFIQEPNIPHSIYEIEGAKNVAIEFKSFSKTAGFTGTRCAYTVIPKQLTAYTCNGEEYSVNSLWKRRQTTKFNGVPYIVQRGAEAVYSDQGQRQINSTINYYMTNAMIIRDGLKDMGIKVFGGINAPYIWIKIPNNISSWDFFDKLLNEANIVGTPGSGFGPSGEGYFRLTAFGKREDAQEAVNRFKTKLNI